MPRPGVRYEETWVHGLKHETNYKFVERCERARTTDTLRDPDSLERYEPDLVITQVGIVDCAPRYSNRYERNLFDVVPHTISKPYMDVMRRLRTRSPRRSYVSPDGFRSNLANYYQRADDIGARVISLKICPPTTLLSDANPLAADSITEYNAIYESIARRYEGVTTVDPFESITNPDPFFVDHEHPNSDGHRLIGDELLQCLNRWPTSSEK